MFSINGTDQNYNPNQNEETQEEMDNNILDTYGSFLEGESQDLIARPKELRQLVEVMSNKDNNNVLIVGDKGVGKTSILNTLSKELKTIQSIKELYILEPSKLVQDTAYRGKFEENVTNIFEYCSQLKESEEKEIVLIIEDISLFANLGKTEGSLSLLTLLPSLMEKYKVSLIVTETYEGYKKMLDNHSDFTSLMKLIEISPTTQEETLAILRAKKVKLQEEYSLNISDKALRKLVELSSKIKSNSPKKEVDMLKQACSKVYVELNIENNELFKVKREIETLDIQINSFHSNGIEETNDSKIELEKLMNHYNDLILKLNALTTVDNTSFTEETVNESLEQSSEGYTMPVPRFNLPSNTNTVQGLERLKNALNDLEGKMRSVKSKMKSAVDFDLPKLVENLKNEEQDLTNQIEDLKNQIVSCEESLQNQNVNSSEESHETFENQEEVIESDDKEFDVNQTIIEEIISEVSKVKVTSLKKSEKQKYIELPNTIKKRVKGQDLAVESISETVLRYKSGIQDQNKPIGSFMFLGQTGVGKTELAKALAEQLFDSESNLIRIDMSEYMEKHSVSRLIGTPPGYVGFESGGQLTELVKNNPNSVVLLDEIEKAHPDVSNILLQILDEGHVTDNQGFKVDFKDTIVILTSNVGARFLTTENINSDFEGTKELLIEELKMHFRPEMINRIDELIMFNSLGEEQFKGISEKFLAQLIDRLKAKNINLEYSEDVINWIVAEGSDSSMGARPIKRFIQKEIENKLAKFIVVNIDETISEKTIKLDYNEEELKISLEQ